MSERVTDTVCQIWFARYGGDLNMEVSEKPGTEQYKSNQSLDRPRHVDMSFSEQAIVLLHDQCRRVKHSRYWLAGTDEPIQATSGAVPPITAAGILPVVSFWKFVLVDAILYFSRTVQIVTSSVTPF